MKYLYFLDLEEKTGKQQTNKNQKKELNDRVFDHVKFCFQLSFNIQILVYFVYQLIKGNTDKLLRAL